MVLRRDRVEIGNSGHHPLGQSEITMRYTLLHRVSPWFLILALILISGCVHRHAPMYSAGIPRFDSIALISVDQLNGNEVKWGTPAHFKVRLEYSLFTYDEALLSFRIDQFPNPNSCVPSTDEPYSANIPVTPATSIRIYRGMHALEFPISWPGDKRDGANKRVSEVGAISFKASMSTTNPHYQFLTRSFGTQFCVRFE